MAFRDQAFQLIRAYLRLVPHARAHPDVNDALSRARAHVAVRLAVIEGQVDINEVIEKGLLAFATSLFGITLAWLPQAFGVAAQAVSVEQQRAALELVLLSGGEGLAGYAAYFLLRLVSAPTRERLRLYRACVEQFKG